MPSRSIALASALSLAVGAVAVGSHFVSSAGNNEETVFVPITPCRLLDTRPGELNVGPRDTKVGADESVEFAAWDGDDDDSTCVIPPTASAIATNTVAIAPTARSFMALFPGGADNPGTANLNYVAAQAPTPNAANIPLSVTGTFNVFNAFGDVHVVIDVNGYYQPSTSIGGAGVAGPPGEIGVDGEPGENGADGADGSDGAAGEKGRTNRISDDQIGQLRWDLDPGAPTTVDVGSFGESTGGMAFDGTHLFVANTDGGAIVVVDPASATVVKTIPIAVGIEDVVYNGTSIYVSNPLTAFVTVIDPVSLTNAETVFGLINEPTRMAAGNDRIYVANNTDVFSVIDATTNTVEFNTGTPFEATAIALWGDKVVIASSGESGTGSLFVMNADLTTSLEFLTLNGEAQDIVVVGDLAFVSYDAAIGSGGVDVIDLVELEFTGGGGGGEFEQMAFDGSFVWAIDGEFNDLSIYGLYGSEREPQQDPGPSPDEIVFDGTSLWVTNSGYGTITRVFPVVFPDY